ncbi:uncharacterized protein ColSpa_11812 [Colletotrichum spaethianum]|uniref:Uncharacterized protein n=1 Tax=Colletotrichum spaethianum TaxID=700344 RepID=A0AA37ULE8_9PEZI|nr:uncharacterized protein ColSpa_11812 [Colletotrichum spaethianum]GKT51631.1 hypothetical protein ColSpa_11812 [Colletotrichum spaethianum]
MRSFVIPYGEDWQDPELTFSKLRGLRTTIPRMMEPLSAKQPTHSVAAAKKEVQDFQDFRKSDEITKIMDHAAKRRKEEPNGIKAWRTTDHPDWTTTTTTTTTDS